MKSVARGYLGTVVWRPTDELQFTLDSFFSKFDNTSFGYGFRSQNFYGNNAQITNPVLSSLGTVIGGTASSNPAGVGGNQFSNETTADNYSTSTNVFSGGLNMKWNHGHWHVEADASLSHASSNEINVDTTADPYTGLGTSNPQLMPQSSTFLLKGTNIGNFSVRQPGPLHQSQRHGLVALRRVPVHLYTTRTKHSAPREVRPAEQLRFFRRLEAGVYANNHDYDAESRSLRLRFGVEHVARRRTAAADHPGSGCEGHLLEG